MIFLMKAFHMNSSFRRHWIAFSGNRRISSGTSRMVVSDVKRFIDLNADQPVLIFDAKTSAVVEIDFRGSLSDVLDRLPAESRQETANVSSEQVPVKAAGRPRLGVVAREVTLLPRHWEWLGDQPGGASVTLRKLVEHALRAAKKTDHSRKAREAAYQFMAAMAGNNPDFEEASRALFACDIARLKQIAEGWPHDVREHICFLADAINTVSEEND